MTFDNFQQNTYIVIIPQQTPKHNRILFSHYIIIGISFLNNRSYYINYNSLGVLFSVYSSSEVIIVSVDSDQVYTSVFQVDLFRKLMQVYAQTAVNKGVEVEDAFLGGFRTRTWWIGGDQSSHVQKEIYSWISFCMRALLS